MKTSPVSQSFMSLSVRVYQALLRGYSPDLRDRYGAEMVQAFRTAVTAIAASEGMAGVLRLWLRTLSDLVATAIADRLASAQERGRFLSLALYGVAIITAVFSGSMHAHDDADAFSAMLLLSGAFICGVCQPERAWRWGLISGMGIPLLLLLPHGTSVDPSRADHDSLLPLVLLPALIAAYAGALAHRVAVLLRPRVPLIDER